MLHFTPLGEGERIPFLRAVGSSAETTARHHAEKSLSRCSIRSLSAYESALITSAPLSCHGNREKEVQ